MQGLEHLRRRNRFLALAPRVVVRDRRDERVAQLRLARKLRLGEDAHVDDVPAPLAVHPALRARGELRALHAHDRLPRVQPRLRRAPQIDLARGGLDDLARARLEPRDELAGEGVAERGMRDDGRALEEARGAHALGAVDDLVGEDEVARGELLAEGADGGEGEDGADAERFEGGDVRARGHGGGRDRVADAVPREEGDLGARGEGADGDGRAGVAPRLGAKIVRLLETWVVCMSHTVTGFTVFLLENRECGARMQVV